MEDKRRATSHELRIPSAAPGEPPAQKYVAPAVTKVGTFSDDTLGDVSVGQSDDSDAGQYYAP